MWKTGMLLWKTRGKPVEKYEENLSKTRSELWKTAFWQWKLMPEMPQNSRLSGAESQFLALARKYGRNMTTLRKKGLWEKSCGKVICGPL